jgi:hypothetical protein
MLDPEGKINQKLAERVKADVENVGATDEDGISSSQQYLLQQYLQAAAEKEMEQKETEQVAENAADNKEGGTGTRAKWS